MRLRRGIMAGLATVLLPGLLVAQSPDFTFSGQVRLRYEWRRPAGETDGSAFTLLRARLGAEATLNEHVQAFLEVQDSRYFGEESSLTSGVAPAFDLHQGYIELSGQVAAMPLALRAGRQVMALGNERLVGAGEWGNTGRAFDGARMLLGPASGRWHATAFVTTLVERGRGFTPADTSGAADHTFLGIDAGSRWLEAYLFQDLGAAFRSYTDADRTTVGGRLVLPTGMPVKGSLEGAVQFGTQAMLPGDAPLSGLARRQEIRAGYIGARLGVGLSARLPLLGLGIDWLSGDDHPDDGTYSAFSTLYGTNHRFYGYLDLFGNPATNTGDRGLIDGMASLQAAVAGPTTLSLDLHHFQLARPAGLATCNLGWELDATLPFRFANAARFQLGYSFYRNGPAAPLIDLGGVDGDTWHWVYVQLLVAF